MSRRYEVLRGDVPCAGSTTPPEFRELCGLRKDHQSVMPDRLSRCLPWVHRGFAGDIFTAYRNRLAAGEMLEVARPAGRQ